MVIKIVQKPNKKRKMMKKWGENTVDHKLQSLGNTADFPSFHGNKSINGILKRKFFKNGFISIS
jgi:hypothetical protein